MSECTYSTANILSRVKDPLAFPFARVVCLDPGTQMQSLWLTLCVCVCVCVCFLGFLFPFLILSINLLGYSDKWLQNIAIDIFLIDGDFLNKKSYLDRGLIGEGFVISISKSPSFDFLVP